MQVYPGVALPTENTAAYYVASPSQNLGGALVVLLGVLAIDLVRGQGRPGNWVLFVVIAAAASGAKATVRDARHFWIAALTERHILVEGWGYTNTINDLVTGTGDKSNRLPFWDPARLQANDRVFTAPTRAALELLRTKYGVRWLYADQSQSPVSRRLGSLVHLRYDAGDVQIYELRAD